MTDHFTDDVCDAQVFEMLGTGITYAIDSQGLIYLNGDLHPRGGPAAINEALAEGIEWIPLNAVQAYFPLTWLAGKCDNGVSPERIIIMANIEQAIRSKG